MLRQILSVFVVLAAAVNGYAASYSRFTMGLGGDNHAAAWKQGQREMFTPGTTNEGKVYRVGDVITWDVILECGGIHQQPGSPADGHEVWGAANIVYDLEIRHETAWGPYASNAVFFSSINDGTGGDPLAPATFAASYNVNHSGPGRLIDTPAHGGPGMTIYTYPTQQPGRLIGQGAGYMWWDRGGGTIAGVGMPWPKGLGVVPIAEGQIDTNGMQPGTYVLRVIPGQGNNILRGDLDMDPYQLPFALPVNETFGDEMTFTLIPEPLTVLLLLMGVSLVGRRPRANG